MWAWLPFFVGLFAGLLAMWLFDLWFYGRRRATIAEMEKLRTQLSQAREESAICKAELSSANQKLEATSKDLVMARADAKVALAKEERSAAQLSTATSNLNVANVEIEKLKKQLASYTASEPEDNLQRVNGIGPAYEKKLKAAGLKRFADIAAANPERLDQIISPQDWQNVDFEAWIEEAKQLAVNSEQ